jgi:hypothetical protein
MIPGSVGGGGRAGAIRRVESRPVIPSGWRGGEARDLAGWVAVNSSRCPVQGIDIWMAASYILRDKVFGVDKKLRRSFTGGTTRLIGGEGAER